MPQTMKPMTKEHPDWDDFLRRLEGPGGCNFKPDMTWKCNCSSKRLLATKILTDMGLGVEEIEQSMDYFSHYGGHCDCEIVFNVAE